jgi:membrane protease YdiL (CAAX protease family)
VRAAFLAVAYASGWGLPTHLGRDFTSWSQAKRYAINSLLLAPLVEETVYRGIVVSALRERLPKWAVILASGAIFYLLHLSYGLDWRLFHFAIAGMILAWAYLATGKLWVPVTLHFLGNVMMGADDLWFLLT